MNAETRHIGKAQLIIHSTQPSTDRVTPVNSSPKDTIVLQDSRPLFGLKVLLFVLPLFLVLFPLYCLFFIVLAYLASVYFPANILKAFLIMPFELLFVSSSLQAR